MKLEPLTLEHFDAMGAWSADTEAKLTYGKGWTLFVDGKPIAMGGIVADPLRPGVGKAWTLHVKHCEQSPLLMRRIHKAVKEKWAETMKDFVRVECETFPGSAPCYNWLIFFGFQYEGIARLFTGSEDRARFAWIR